MARNLTSYYTRGGRHLIELISSLVDILGIQTRRQRPRVRYRSMYSLRRLSERRQEPQWRSR